MKYLAQFADTRCLGAVPINHQTPEVVGNLSKFFPSYKQWPDQYDLIISRSHSFAFLKI